MIPPDASDIDHQQAVSQLGQENRNLRQQINVLQAILQEQELKQKKLVHEAEMHYQALAEISPVGIFRTDAEGKTVYVNSSWCQIAGFSKEESLGDGWIQAIHPEDREKVDREWQQAMLAARSSQIEYRYQYADGTIKWVRGQAEPEKDNDGNAIGYVGTITDITEHKQREREMESLSLLSNALRTAQTRAEMLPLLLEQVMRLINTQGAAIAMRDQASGDIVYEYTTGVLATSVRHCLAEGNGISGHVIASGQAYVHNDEEMDPLFEYPIEAKNLHNLACVPLITQKTTIGSLLVERKDKFTPEDIRLLTALADMAASAINRITLFEQTERYAHQMAMAGEIGWVLAETLDLPTIYERLGKSVEELLPDVSHLFISRYNPQEKTFSCMYALADNEIINPADLPPVPLEPPGHGTQSEVVHTRRPVILNDLPSKLPKVVIHVGAGGPITQSGLYVPMLSRGQVAGVVQVQSYIPNRFTQSDVEVLTLVGNTAAVAIDNARLFQDLQHSNQELIKAYAETIEGWSSALDMRDQETEGHSKRVTELTLALARKLGYPEDQMENMRRGALLHDIGKMVIPDRILLKPDQLTVDESIVMREHPVYAYEFLSTIAYLRPALAIPYCHHEKWDGSGYPRGIKGVEIPLAARIFAVVDVWDALTSDRPYRPAWSKRRTVEYIRSESGKHFDPQVVYAFVEMISTI